MEPARSRRGGRAGHRRGSATCRTSRSASSTSTASCAASTCRARSSCRRSRAASASATSCSAGTARTSSTTTCKFTGWHTGYPDAPVRILPDSCRPLPFEDDGLFFLGEFAPPAETVCPRGLLRRVLERGRALGFEAYAGFEYEFFVFKETPESVREKNYRDLHADGARLVRLLGDPQQRRAATSTARCSTPARRWTSASRACTRRPAPACIEAAIAFDKALAAADKAALFKTFAKVLAQKHGSWRRSWRSGRRTGRARAATSTCR